MNSELLINHQLINNQLINYLRYLESLNYSAYSLKTIRTNLGVFQRWLERVWQLDTLIYLQRKHLEAWLRYLHERRTTRGHPLKASSVNKYIEAVRGLIKYLSKQGVIQPGLIETIDYVKEPRVLPTSVLTHAQVRKLLNTISTQQTVGYRDRAMLELLYSTGIRAGELLRLNCEDVDFRNCTALIQGKGKKERVVPIGRTALRYLESYLKAVRPFLILSNRDERAVFIDQNGQRIKHHVLAKRIHHYAHQAKIEINVTPHTFRRSCTTELLRNGANMYHVKELLGHETLDTLRHYARLTIADLKKTHAKCHPRERGA